MEEEKLIFLSEIAGWKPVKYPYDEAREIYFPKIFKGDLELKIEEYIPHKPEGISQLKELLLSLHPDIIDEVYENWFESMKRVVDEYEEYKTSFAMWILKEPENVCETIYEVFKNKEK